MKKQNDKSEPMVASFEAERPPEITKEKGWKCGAKEPQAVEISDEKIDSPIVRTIKRRKKGV